MTKYPFTTETRRHFQIRHGLQSRGLILRMSTVFGAGECLLAKWRALLEQRGARFFRVPAKCRGGEKWPVLIRPQWWSKCWSLPGRKSEFILGKHKRKVPTNPHQFFQWPMLIVYMNSMVIIGWWGKSHFPYSGERSSNVLPSLHYQTALHFRTVFWMFWEAMHDASVFQVRHFRHWRAEAFLPFEMAY